MSIRVAITGATGYIGRALLRYLHRPDFECVAFITETAQNNLPENIRILRGNLMDSCFLRNNMTDIDVVIHLAGLKGCVPCSKSISRAITTNVGLTQAVTSAVPSGALLVLGSSYWVYGHRYFPPYRESEPVSPSEPYGWTKSLAEEIVRERDGSHVILRMGNVFGYDDERKSDDVVSLFLEKALNSGVINLMNGGINCIDLIYLIDFCEVVRRLILAPHGRLTVNVGGGVPIRIVDLALIVNQVTMELVGRKAKIVTNDESKGIIDSVDRWMDTSLLIERTGYDMRTLKESILATAEMMIQKKDLNSI